MIRLGPQRGWLIALILITLTMAGAVPLFRNARSALDAQSANAAQNIKRLNAALAEARADTDTTNSGVVLLPEERRTLLAPTRRSRALAGLDRLADSYAITAPRWTLSPEEHTSALPDGVTSATLSLAVDAPEDVSAWHFLDDIRHTLPGRAHLVSLVMERRNATSLTAANLAIEARFAWLANDDTARTAP